MAFNPEIPCEAKIEYKKSTEKFVLPEKTVFNCESCQIHGVFGGPTSEAKENLVTVKLLFCKNLNNILNKPE